MKLPLIIALLVIIQHVFAQKTILEGTVIRVRLTETLNSRTCIKGDKVNLEVAAPSMVDGVTVVETGAKVIGKITESVKNKNLGRKGKLNFSIDSVNAKDGQYISLISEAEKERPNKLVRFVATAALINPLALFIKGKAAIIYKGAQFNCRVSRSTVINLE